MENEDGYRLWLRYPMVSDKMMLEEYNKNISNIIIPRISPILKAAGNELVYGLENLLGRPISINKKIQNGTIIAGKIQDLQSIPIASMTITKLSSDQEVKKVCKEGYTIRQILLEGKMVFVITAGSDIGVLYGVFHFLKVFQTNKPVRNISLVNSPRIRLRLLNHWDNLDRTIERGYAGFSFWDWHTLPGYLSPRYTDYARACASVGINGTVLNNVNANALSLTGGYLEKTKVLADLFRIYGIKVYLSARFSAPMEIGELKTSDPCNKKVANWWKNKADEIHEYIPDFGGFLVKANSEGQPGPQDYGRSHADGANMLAQALAPYGGKVIWRAFVYDFKIKEDRAKQAFNEFTSLDGKFKENVLVQVKNGPIDFQPREPFHPLFGAMPGTPLMMEFQLTQEYLGLATHLVYLGPLFSECLESDTFAMGSGSTVARVIDGTLYTNTISGIAGVANTGSDRNWCGHHFAQANWYAFGRLAWDHTLSPADIAEDWIRMTFSNEKEFIEPVKSMMLSSRETAVNYMTPLGLHHIMAGNHHYGPGPWVDKGRPDWTSIYYHRADKTGIGFDRTASGSNAIGQYSTPLERLFGDRDTCPQNLLLWFHHMNWDWKIRSGRSVWEELCYKYYQGVESVREMQKTWDSLQGLVDEQRFMDVQACLKIQEKEAVWWRDACILYFQSFSGLPIPDGYEKPAESLDYYKKLRHYFVPGISNPFKGGERGR